MLELVVLKGKVFELLRSDGDIIDGVAFSIHDDHIAFKKDDVYYIFEDKKEYFFNHQDMSEKDIVNLFFDEFPYMMESYSDVGLKAAA